MLVSFILIASANGKNNWMRVTLHHPMLLRVKLWAFSHLIKATLLAIVAGVIGWLVMIMWLHELLIGVKPFG
jgi:uncharacterized membrane protein